MTTSDAAEASPLGEGQQGSSRKNKQIRIPTEVEWTDDWWFDLNEPRQLSVIKYVIKQSSHFEREAASAHEKMLRLAQENEELKDQLDLLTQERELYRAQVSKLSQEQAASESNRLRNVLGVDPPSLSQRKSKVLDAAYQTIEARSLDTVPRIQVELQVHPQARVLAVLDMIPSEMANEVHMESLSKAIKRAYPTFQGQTLSPVWFSDTHMAPFKKANDKVATLKNEWAQQQERYWFLALRIFQRLVSIRCDRSFQVNRFDECLMDMGLLIHHFLAKFANTRRDLIVSAAYSKIAANQFKAQQHKVNVALSADMSYRLCFHRHSSKSPSCPFGHGPKSQAHQTRISEFGHYGCYACFDNDVTTHLIQRKGKGSCPLVNLISTRENEQPFLYNAVPFSTGLSVRQYANYANRIVVNSNTNVRKIKYDNLPNTCVSCSKEYKSGTHYCYDCGNPVHGHHAYSESVDDTEVADRSWCYFCRPSKFVSLTENLTKDIRHPQCISCDIFYPGKYVCSQCKLPLHETCASKVNGNFESSISICKACAKSPKTNPPITPKRKTVPSTMRSSDRLQRLRRSCLEVIKKDLEKAGVMEVTGGKSGGQEWFIARKFRITSTMYP
eukprot:Nk52_evm92s164 gene=Nk52_evmTU92s164